MMKRFCATLLLLAWLFAAFAAERSSTIVYVNGKKYYVHTVQSGETLYAISKAYKVDEKAILEHNPAASAGLKPNEKLRIPFTAEIGEQLSERKLKRTFNFHIVSKGETLYAISRKYEISIDLLLEDNPNLDPTKLELGQRILIRKKAIGSQEEAETKEEWENYRQTMTSIADAGYAYHIVAPGETFYALSRRFGITEEELGRINGGLKPSELKAGAMIKVPGNGTAAQSADTVADAATNALILENERIEEIEFRALQRSQPLRAALLLPLTTGNATAANSNYLEFYQGFLMGLDSVKRRGYSVELHLYDTKRDSARVREIVESPEFAEVNLIVGPVYEEELYPVIRFAEKQRIPVVSPLANIARMNSDVLFQLAPVPSRKYEKAAELVKDRRITLIGTASNDKEFEREVLTLLGNTPYTRYTYKYEHPTVAKEESPSNLTPLLENDDDNLFIILADNEVDVDRILAALASADTNLTSRGRTAPRFSVLGNTRWNRYNNLDRAMLFKDRVTFISNYHAKRDAQVIRTFDRDYIRAFGTLPTLFSYRGYDAALIFCPAMYNDIEYDMEGRRYTPLQSTYLFGQEETSHNHVNRNWIKATYNKDFTITVE